MCVWPKKYTRDKINEKRESTLRYLAVVPITTYSLKDLSQYSPRIRKLAQIDAEKPLFRNFEAVGSTKPDHVPNRREKIYTRNPLKSAKEASLLRPAHPYPFSSEHPSSCVIRVLL